MIVKYMINKSLNQSLWLSENFFLDLIFSIDYSRMSNVFGDVNVGAQNHHCNIPLILDKYKIMIVMQKLKCRLEFTFAINLDMST